MRDLLKAVDDAFPGHRSQEPRDDMTGRLAAGAVIAGAIAGAAAGATRTTEPAEGRQWIYLLLFLFL